MYRPVVSRLGNRGFALVVQRVTVAIAGSNSWNKQTAMHFALHLTKRKLRKIATEIRFTCFFALIFGPFGRTSRSVGLAPTSYISNERTKKSSHSVFILSTNIDAITANAIHTTNLLRRVYLIDFFFYILTVSLTILLSSLLISRWCACLGLRKVKL